MDGKGPVLDGKLRMVSVGRASTCDIQNGLSELVGVARAFRGGGSLGFHRDIARGAVKDDAVHGFENRKAFGNAIHLYIERAIHL